jgi:peptidyl-dipeptidase Dcp
MRRTMLLLASCLAPIMSGPAWAADPFAEPSRLPFHAPPFDRITDADYQPAFEAGMADHAAEIARIAADPAPPTFANTLEAMERAGQRLDRVEQAFGAVVQANTNPVLDKTRATEAPKLAAHRDAIMLNKALFARVKSLHDRQASLGLSPEQARLLDVTYDQFVRAGALLNEADQTRLKDLNRQLSMLQTTFQSKLLAATKAGALTVDTATRLNGFDAGAIAAAAQDAKDRGQPGKFTLPLQNTTQQPALTNLADRSTRLALFDQSWTRAEKGDANDTRATIVRIAELRAEKAKLLGFPNYSAYALGDQMAKTPEAANGFLQRLAPATAMQEKREAAEIQAVIDKQGGGFKLSPADWQRYSEQVRKAKYDLSDEALKPYLELSRVLQDGVFFAANRLYGLTFKERHDLPVYQPDVRVFTVYDADGSELGLYYCDPWKRDNKAGGAWMSNFVGGNKLLGTKPVVYNVWNFTKPAPGQPQLITFEDVTTMFHEFGHALHGLFANTVYPSLASPSSARDWVEFPSQFNEHWALDPVVVANYAKDYRTGAPMPAALVAKIKQAATFNQGYRLGELLAAMKLDLAWHQVAPGTPIPDADRFEADALAATGLDVKDVPPRYRSSYFAHIWGSGYASGYYAYAWTEMLDDDAYAWFAAHGGMTRANGQRFRSMILSKGSTEDYGAMFRAFAGRDPDITPMLQHRGLAPGGE